MMIATKFGILKILFEYRKYHGNLNQAHRHHHNKYSYNRVLLLTMLYIITVDGVRSCHAQCVAAARVCSCVELSERLTSRLANPRCRAVVVRQVSRDSHWLVNWGVPSHPSLLDDCYRLVAAKRCSFVTPIKTPTYMAR
ncbi:hypothetical protein RRG08_059951 [Elysia crispata]|uniref:Uncharacterized protein n=1 Tax=Elysia crispata TaxID=231223 RepID=A0AAE0Y759_9GAST|nr:hypothetical protein RRG08_059951 [Elysia crispata]